MDPVMTKLRSMGAKLEQPPADLSAKLSLLDEVEGLLSRLGQDWQDAIHLAPSLKNNILGEGWFRSSDASVKISSLVCIHELMRITSPFPPYQVRIMKEIMEETVKAFKNLASGFGRSFQKARKMLHYVATFQSGLFLLDLGSQPSVVQLFQIFLHDIQSDYPADVVSDMESVMTRLIMDADDDLSVDMLRPLLLSIGAESQIKSPPSAQLGMKVLQECSAVVKPFLDMKMKQMRQDLESCSYGVALMWPEDNVRREADRIVLGSDEAGTSRSGALLGRKRSRNVAREAEREVPAEPGTSTSGALPRRRKSMPMKLADYVIYEPPRRRSGETASGNAQQSLPQPQRSEVREELIGARVKVWWPADKVYYEGRISSYEPVGKRHKVVYNDGDVEMMRLDEEQWFLVDSSSTTQEGRQEPNRSGHYRANRARPTSSSQLSM